MQTGSWGARVKLTAILEAVLKVHPVEVRLLIDDTEFAVANLYHCPRES
jgi:hypothetical protein